MNEFLFNLVYNTESTDKSNFKVKHILVVFVVSLYGESSLTGGVTFIAYIM